MSRRRYVLSLVLALVLVLNAVFPSPVSGFSSFSNARWLVYFGALNMVQALDPGIAGQYWNTTLTNIQNSSDPPASKVPAGWVSVPDQKFTAYGDCSSTGDPSCTSFSTDVTNGSITSSAIPVVLYDPESWTQTPATEQQNPCSFMQQFASLAHTNGFQTIMAPAQDLVSVLTAFIGGETQNWQPFMRLGIPACAARYSDRYTIQAQANQEDPDFIAFTTQAALQARGANPSVVLTSGLATNRVTGDVPTPQKLYEDSLGVQNVVDGFWLNIPSSGCNNDGVCQTQRPDNAVQYMELGAGLLPFYLHPSGGFDTTYPTGTTASTFSLSTAGASLTSTTSQTFAAGTVIPAGKYKFQPFTDGTTGTAGLGLEVGYCVASSCSTSHTPIIPSSSWTASVGASGTGITSTFTTASATTLPAGGPYDLYFKITVNTAGSFNLLYNSMNTAESNLAIPRPSALPAPTAQSPMFFLHSGGGFDSTMPTGATASTMSLATTGASTTWLTSQTYLAGTVIPAGRYLFQAWTDGTTGTAQLGLEFGYCTAASCGTSQNAIVSPFTWNPTVSAGSKGDKLDSNGLNAASTTASTTLPSGGPFRLYLQVSVQTAGSFNLKFDSATTATNIGTTFLH